MFSPSYSTVPSSGRKTSAIMRRSVVLPAPLMPTSPNTEASGTVRETPLKTSFVP